MTARWLVVLLLAAACDEPRSMGGPIEPPPPGPMDVVRGWWGDYGGRCPGDYRYCKGQGEAICCPPTSRCEEDAGGAYCEPFLLLAPIVDVARATEELRDNVTAGIERAP